MTLSDLNNLDFSDIGNAPAAVKGLLILIVVAVVGAGGYWFHVKDMLADLDNRRGQEAGLKMEFEQKQSIAANFDAYRARLEELDVLLAELVRQLPTRTEMPDLLEEVSNLGRSNGLVFQLFRPEGERRQEFFAVVPISIRATGSYHQFGEFISSISAMERIVTLENATLTVPGGRSLTEVTIDDLNIEATLQTYRYLDAEEGGG